MENKLEIYREHCSNERCTFVTVNGVNRCVIYYRVCHTLTVSKTYYIAKLCFLCFTKTLTFPQFIVCLSILIARIRVALPLQFQYPHIIMPGNAMFVNLTWVVDQYNEKCHCPKICRCTYSTALGIKCQQINSHF